MSGFPRFRRGVRGDANADCTHDPEAERFDYPREGAVLGKSLNQLKNHLSTAYMLCG